MVVRIKWRKYRSCCRTSLRMQRLDTLREGHLKGDTSKSILHRQSLDTPKDLWASALGVHPISCSALAGSSMESRLLPLGPMAHADIRA